MSFGNDGYFQIFKKDQKGKNKSGKRTKYCVLTWSFQSSREGCSPISRGYQSLSWAGRAKNPGKHSCHQQKSRLGEVTSLPIVFEGLVTSYLFSHLCFGKPLWGGFPNCPPTPVYSGTLIHVGCQNGYGHPAGPVLLSFFFRPGVDKQRVCLFRVNQLNG